MERLLNGVNDNEDDEDEVSYTWMARNDIDREEGEIIPEDNPPAVENDIDRDEINNKQMVIGKIDGYRTDHNKTDVDYPTRETEETVRDNYLIIKKTHGVVEPMLEDEETQ
ncbi:hypothetical protein L1887_36061 [Cichorium endivia]|nr:hypothetical protein L1887_36061 [Cichorium endivia]